MEKKKGTITIKVDGSALKSEMKEQANRCADALANGYVAKDNNGTATVFIEPPDGYNVVPGLEEMVHENIRKAMKKYCEQLIERMKDGKEESES